MYGLSKNVNCACDPSVLLDVPPIGLFVFVGSSPHLGV